MSDLHDLTAVEQRDALRAGAFTAVELTEHYLDRIDKYGADLGAFVEVTPDLARREALAADVRLRAGEHAPLLGLPLAFKDLHAVAGVRVRLGSAAVDVVPEQDGRTVSLLRRAGAVTVGTTHAPELGPTCFTHSAVVAHPAVTPYDTSRYASGSSGGAAAAVAAGLLPFGHASDGAGSIRTPAAVCGLVGLKPSRGLVSAGPRQSFLSLGTEGPITRTVADAALMLAVMAQAWPGDLYPKPATHSLLEGWTEQPPRLRVLRVDDSGLDRAHSECTLAVDRTEQVLKELGHDVVAAPNPVPWTEDLVAAMGVVATTATASAALRIAPTQELRSLLHPYTQWCIEEAAGFTAVDFVAAQSMLASASSTLLAAHAAFDVVLTPTTSQPAVPVGWFSEQGEGRACAERMLAWSAYTPWANLTGQPALSLPLHLSPEGLPVGVQLVGSRAGDDVLLLRLAAEIEAAVPFAHRHPPQW